ncbi:MAG: dTMP kinase [Caulobacteraceae bacterium]|nr:dTMP kinase [Caulobacteraceae bacterium]
MTRGRFITLEGGEGVGKSTQAAILTEHLQSLGIEVLRTREPGGSENAEALRDLVVKGEAGRWSPVAETLLMYAARADHLERMIRPALARGAWVVCDRFADSTRAYQGAGGGVAPAVIEGIDAAVVGGDQPDLTLVFDMPVEIGLDRAFGRDMFEARFESKGHAFHQRLRDHFLAIARAEPGRCVIVDAAGQPDAVADAVWKAMQARFPELAAAAPHLTSGRHA